MKTVQQIIEGDTDGVHMLGKEFIPTDEMPHNPCYAAGTNNKPHFRAKRCDSK